MMMINDHDDDHVEDSCDGDDNDDWRMMVMIVMMINDHHDDHDEDSCGGDDNDD